MPERPWFLLGGPERVDWFAGLPRKCAGSPEGRVDPFSEILIGVKLNGAVFFNAEFSDPWGFTSPASQTLACTLAPGSASSGDHHLLTEGCALAQTGDMQAMSLEPGDVVIFPHGDPHLIRGRRARPSRNLNPRSCRSSWITTWLPWEPVVVAKPRELCAGSWLAIRTSAVRSSMDCRLSWRSMLGPIDPASSWGTRSCTRWTKQRPAGWAAMLCWRSFLRHSSSTLCANTSQVCLNTRLDGAGVRDPSVGKSLGLLHRKIDYPWTIADLASEVGLSRSALVERFTRYLSEPPMTYLTRRRL